MDQKFYKISHPLENKGRKKVTSTEIEVCKVVSNCIFYHIFLEKMKKIFFRLLTGPTEHFLDILALEKVFSDSDVSVSGVDVGVLQKLFVTLVKTRVRAVVTTDRSYHIAALSARKLSINF